MRHRIAHGIFPEIGLDVRNKQAVGAPVGSLDHVQVRAFRSRVIEIHEQSRRELVLDVEVPNLYVAEAVIAVHRVIVGDRGRRRRRKTVCEGQRKRRRLDVRRGH